MRLLRWPLGLLAMTVRGLVNTTLRIVQVHLLPSLIFYLPLRLETRNDAVMLIICYIAYDAKIFRHH